MTEVLMIGIRITIVKMTRDWSGGATGLFAFGALTLMLAHRGVLRPKILWNIGEHLPGPRRRRSSA
jgi:paraquat-inducible protein A